jgi:hypothetical protein
MKPIANALGADLIGESGAAVNNSLKVVGSIGGFQFDLSVQPRLSGWGDRFAIFRTDSASKPLLRQEEVALTVKSKAEGSEYAFDTKQHAYAVDTTRAAGYMDYTKAVQVQFT